MDKYLNDIADYFDGHMTMEQANAFIEAVSSNEELRKLFEEELITRSLFEEELSDINQPADKAVNSLMFQSADEHISMIEKGLSGTDENKKNQTPVVPFYTKYKYAISAAAVLIIIILSDLFIFNPEHRAIIANLFKKEQNAKDTAIHINDTIQPIKRPGQNSIQIAALSSEELYSKYHTYYDGGLEPPEGLEAVSSWTINRKYSKVLAKNDDDYQVRGDRKDELKTCFFSFYKGISFLESNEPDSAVVYLDIALKNKSAPGSLKYEAQWYYALSMLKRRNLAAAKKALEEIAVDENSPKQPIAINALKDIE